MKHFSTFFILKCIVNIFGYFIKLFCHRFSQKSFFYVYFIYRIYKENIQNKAICHRFYLFCHRFSSFCHRFYLFCHRFSLFCHRFSPFCHRFYFCVWSETPSDRPGPMPSPARIAHRGSPSGYEPWQLQLRLSSILFLYYENFIYIVKLQILFIN